MYYLFVRNWYLNIGYNFFQTYFSAQATATIKEYKRISNRCNDSSNQKMRDTRLQGYDISCQLQHLVENTT